MVNVEHFHRTMENVSRETLDMRHWAIVQGTEMPDRLPPCGTTMCLAGTAVVTAGIGLQWEPHETEERLNSDGEWEDVVTAWKADYTEDGDDIETKGAELLGLDEVTANDLFHLTDIQNDVDELWEAVEEYTDGEVRRPVSV
jgi:hypothetical protein